MGSSERGVSTDGAGPAADVWRLWSATLPARPERLRHARVALAEALVGAGWGTDAGRVLLAVGDAMDRSLAATGGPEALDVAFLVGATDARVRITGAPCAAGAHGRLADAVRPRRSGGREGVVMRFHRVGRGGPPPAA